MLVGLGLLALLVAAVWLPARLRPRAPELPVYAVLPSFALTDQAGAPFGRERLLGAPTIVNFIFTSCPTICPLLTRKMHTLQDWSAGSAVRLVSFSVDPETDTPPVLRAYGEKHGADFARWTFVTGDREAVDSAVVAGFKVALERLKPGATQAPDIWEIVHGERFVLVDGEGRIRGYYDALDDDMRRLVSDARALAASAR